MTDSPVEVSDGGSPQPSLPAACVRAGVPSHCDVCHRALGALDEYRPMTIVRDSTPRRLRETHGGGFIEDEWQLGAVCELCHRRFEIWLFGDLHEVDTIPAPPEDALECGLERLGIDLGVETVPASDSADGVDDSTPIASVPPNRS